MCAQMSSGILRQLALKWTAYSYSFLKLYLTLTIERARVSAANAKGVSMTLLSLRLNNFGVVHQLITFTRIQNRNKLICNRVNININQPFDSPLTIDHVCWLKSHRFCCAQICETALIVEVNARVLKDVHLRDFKSNILHNFLTKDNLKRNVFALPRPLFARIVLSPFKSSYSP